MFITENNRVSVEEEGTVDFLLLIDKLTDHAEPLRCTVRMKSGGEWYIFCSINYQKLQ